MEMKVCVLRKHLRLRMLRMTKFQLNKNKYKSHVVEDIEYLTIILNFCNKKTMSSHPRYIKYFNNFVFDVLFEKIHVYNLHTLRIQNLITLKLFQYQ